MKRYLTLGLLILSISIPSIARAQGAYIGGTGSATFNSPYNSCVALQNNMSYRSRDIYTNGEVSILQDFLQSRGYLASEPTGYYGLLTVNAVSSYQRYVGISPAGSVNDATRIRIQNDTCGGSTSNTTYTNNYTYNTGCGGNNIFNTITGQRCGATQYYYPVGCSSYQGYSSTTGQSCGNTTTYNNYPTYVAPTVSLSVNNISSTGYQEPSISVGNSYPMTISWSSSNASYCSTYGQTLLLLSDGTRWNNSNLPTYGTRTFYVSQQQDIQNRGMSGATIGLQCWGLGTNSTAYDNKGITVNWTYPTNYDLGCASGAPYSSTTGAPCWRI